MTRKVGATLTVLAGAAILGAVGYIISNHHMGLTLFGAVLGAVLGVLADKITEGFRA